LTGVFTFFGAAGWGLVRHFDSKIEKLEGNIEKLEGNLEKKIDKLADCFAAFAEQMSDRVGNIEGRLQIPFDKNAPAFNQIPTQAPTLKDGSSIWF
jgi:DNA anti-recombination protein RmuC